MPIQGLKEKQVAWFVYNIIFAAVYVIMLPHFVLRMRRRGGYGKDFFHRFGCYSEAVREKLRSGDWIWVQAVSVGEIYVALALIDEMRKKGCSCSFVLSTTTSTAYEIISKKLDSRDQAIYFPADFPFIVRKVFKLIRPRALILVESEIWPNLIRCANSAEVPVLLVNGRISEGSERGYRLMKSFFKQIINSFRLVLVQSDSDKRRLISLGAKEDLPEVCGSLKYDVVRCNTDGEKLSRKVLDACGAGGKQIIVGGSTWPGEEESLVQAYKEISNQMKNVFLVLVPRHAERRAEVEAVLNRHNLSYAKRTDMDTDCLKKMDKVSVLLVDVTGELVGYYACADVIFVGKSLAEHGGQNFIEPAMFGKPVIVGPNLENFSVVAEDFRKAEAFMQINDADSLTTAVRRLMSDREGREQLGARARRLVKDKQGLLGRIAERINDLVA